MNEPIQDQVVTLTNLTYGGDAMGRLPDGKAVFVPFGLPGERVRVKIVEEKRGHARAELVEVLEPVKERILPRCIHFTACGGCHYQHLPYAAQLKAKRQILREQLERIGGISSPPVAEMVPSPQEWYYRNHIQFHLSAQGKLGYQAPQSNQVIEIQECHLPEPILNQLWPQLDLSGAQGLDRIAFRLGSGEETLLLLESSDPVPPELNVEMALSVVYKSPEGEIVLAGEDFQLMEILGRSFQVSAGSFFQVNTLQAEQMVGFLLDNLELGKAKTLIELYCGVGLFSAFIAPRVKKLVGIEQSPSACVDFAANLDEFDHVELYQGAVEEVLPALKLSPDIVLADPPRTGIDRRAMDALLSLKPHLIAYVSCDPSTLARDAKRLTGVGYRLKQVTPFDMFPHTYHIESISLFSSRDG